MSHPRSDSGGGGASQAASTPVRIPTSSRMHANARALSPASSTRSPSSVSPHSPQVGASSPSGVSLGVSAVKLDSRSGSIPIPHAHAALAARFGQPRALSGAAASQALASAYEQATQQQQRQQHHSRHGQASHASATGSHTNEFKFGAQHFHSAGAATVSTSLPASMISPLHATAHPVPTPAASSASPPHAAVPAASWTQSAIAQPAARSLPVSIPAFRRAVSFVGRPEGFDLWGPDLDLPDAPASSTASGGSAAANTAARAPPKIQNVSQLGQQLRLHVQHQQAQGAASAAASSHSAMFDAEQLAHGLDLGDGIPEISSPPPAAQLQLKFDAPVGEELLSANGASLYDVSRPSQPGPRLNFDAVHNARDQVLGAIPHLPEPTPAYTIFQPPAALTAASRWGPMSSSAPSQMPSFRHQRRGSGTSSIASTLAPAQASSHHRRRAGGAHTPSTANSDDPRSDRPDSAQGVRDRSWTPVLADDLEDEVNALISHTFHGDASDCSLSSCSSCSEESVDFPAGLEDDFDVTLTFKPSAQHDAQQDTSDVESDGERQVNRAVQERLSKHKREHHQQRHLHHRRLRMRAQLKARDEARAQDDEWKSAHANEDDLVRIGSYTNGERAKKIQRFLEKRRRRVWSKKILYSCRKSFADARPRVGGRFVKLHGTGDADSAAGGALGGSGSLSASPTLLGLHAPMHLHALTQHMHGNMAAHGGAMTAFSLPLAAYAHTPLDQQHMQLPAQTLGAQQPYPLGALSFMKQEAPSLGASSSSSAAPSGLAAALRGPQQQQGHTQQTHFG